ncbi:hypothetical protein SFA35_11375 [Pseudomonas sp. HR96]|uniref:hypothetical protein n=1 Tax=Pseudomonas sp. HR96 TaxID=1027966 RepID=UPI002A75E069|nr:hypothetical protein [Pseudomonas sp. HR96]WPP01905.1 hypothetical protein SFA35_11375 [Pseudomonas sp. HR96]
MSKIIEFLWECPEWFGNKTWWRAVQVVRLLPMVLLTVLGTVILIGAWTDPNGRMDAVLLGLLCFEAGLLVLGVTHLTSWVVAWLASHLKRRPVAAALAGLTHTA